MKLNKVLIGGLAALTATTGLLATTISAASADPTRLYAAVGSDTIQDVWNGLTNDFGAYAPSIASWNAFPNPPAADTTTGNVYIQTKTNGNWFIRPSGSGEGVKALSAVWDTTDHANQLYPFTGTTAAKLNHEDVDFARSSSGPASGSGLSYLPFARDAVTLAYRTASGLPANLSLTTSEIKELYTGIDDTTDSVVTFQGLSGGTTGTPLSTTTVFITPPGGSPIQVQPIIPQSGSGTRKFFLGAIGVSNNIGAEAPYIADPGLPAAGGVPENDGTSMPAADDVMPFSAAQFIAQANGVAPADTTSGVSLASITGAAGAPSGAAVTGTAPSLSQGPLFGTKNGVGDFGALGTGLPTVGTFARDTYVVVPTTFTTGSATLKQSALVSIISGALGGAAPKAVIRSFGFGSLSYVGNTANYRTGGFTIS
jgi:hypothetical protein